MDEPMVGPAPFHPVNPPVFVEIKDGVVLYDGQPRFGLAPFPYRSGDRPDATIRIAMARFENTFGIVLDWSSDVQRAEDGDELKDAASDVQLLIFHQPVLDETPTKIAEFAFAYVADLPVVVDAIQRWSSDIPDVDGLFSALADRLLSGKSTAEYLASRQEGLGDGDWLVQKYANPSAPVDMDELP